MNFDMLKLGAFTLGETGGNPEPFLRRIEDLEEQWAPLETEAARLQQELYDAIQVAWKERTGETL